MRPWPASRRAGFTLIEVLVALVIVATAMVSLLGLQARNIEVAAIDLQLQQMTFLARDLLTRTLIESPFPDEGVLTGDFEEAPGLSWEVRVEPGEIEELSEDFRRVVVRVYEPSREADAMLLVTHVRRLETGGPR